MVEWFDKLGRSRKKWKKILYWVILILYFGMTGVIGIFVGLFVNGGLIYIEHWGWFGQSSFNYYNLNSQVFPTSLYQNNTYSPLLKVGNNWKNEIGAMTIINITPKDSGVTINCMVDAEYQTCMDYQITTGLSQILQLNISIGFPTPQPYKICFTTNEGNNKGNSIFQCIDVVILPAK
ncbi:MAG TPA: hypothetical protein VI564_03600 [Candidatus Nanoarchaeia archaeon]|nr:hypothetical protein [Candidatus Nanoarchaeia archaeon]